MTKGEGKPVSPFKLRVAGKTWREWRKEFPVERKPVYCAHPNPLPADHLYKIWHCNTCGGSWAANRETPRIAIGYTEAGEDGGRAK